MESNKVELNQSKLSGQSIHGTIHVVHILYYEK